MGAFHFNSSVESYRCWHDGDIFLEQPEHTSESGPNTTLSGVYEGYVPYGQQECQILLEVEDSVSADTYFLRMHMLECKTNLASNSVQKAGFTAASARISSVLRRALHIPGFPQRRLLSAEPSAGTAVVEIVNMTSARVTFIQSNSSRTTLASFDSFSIPVSYESARPGRRLWFINAPDSAAIGAQNEIGVRA